MSADFRFHWLKAVMLLRFLLTYTTGVVNPTSFKDSRA